MKRMIALTAVLALVLLACSGGTGAPSDTGAPSGSEAAPTTGATQETEAPAATEPAAEGVQAAADACTLGETDGDLNLYNWSEYIPTGSLADDAELTDLVAKFEDEFGVNVVLTEYDSNELMLAQIDAGVGYDVIVPSDYMVSIMQDAGLLVKLNKDAIPNMSNIAELFSDPPYDPGNQYSAPYQWGTTGIG